MGNLIGVGGESYFVVGGAGVKSSGVGLWVEASVLINVAGG